jgi:hypothetical protein
MSFDPYGHLQPLPPPQTQAPDGTTPGPAASGPAEAARERALLPGIFLIVLGAINLLWVLFLVVMGLAYAGMTHERWDELKQKMNEKQRAYADEQEAQMKQAGMDFVTFASRIGVGSCVLAALTFLASLLLMAGGYAMCRMRSWGLAVFAAAVAGVPLATSCCGVGQLVAVWALIVLLSNDVRNAFR